MDCGASFYNYKKDLGKIIQRSFEKVLQSELQCSVVIITYWSFMKKQIEASLNKAKLQQAWYYNNKSNKTLQSVIAIYHICQRENNGALLSIKFGCRKEKELCSNEKKSMSFISNIPFKSSILSDLKFYSFNCLRSFKLQTCSLTFKMQLCFQNFSFWGLYFIPRERSGNWSQIPFFFFFLQWGFHNEWF